MPKALRRSVDRLAAIFGYVPASSMQVRIAALEARMAKVAEQNEQLVAQITAKENLDHQMSRLREMQVEHANETRGIQRAVVEMDKITGRLVSLIQVTWPDRTDATVATTEHTTDGTKEHPVV